MASFDDNGEWMCIRRHTNRRRVAEAALVLTAVDIDNHIEHEARHWCLWVRLSQVDAAVAQLDSYGRENAPLPRAPVAVPVDAGWAGVLGYLAVIWLLPTLEANAVFGWDWRELGLMQSDRVTAGEWWRTVTALTLHADLGHIVANSCFGAVFGVFVGRHLGSGLGWLLVLLAGAAGNGFNAIVQPDGFRSLGASTATFAAMGLGAAYVWRSGYLRRLDWRRSFAPLFAAVALLVYTGVGDENTDVVAHFAGFGCGVAAGLAAAGFDITRLGRSGQYLAAALALAILVTAWGAAGRAQ